MRNSHLVTVLAAGLVISSTGTLRAAIRVKVPATRPFTDTGVELTEGERFSIRASGEIEIGKPPRWVCADYERRVGPRGTYDWPDSVRFGNFPLAAAERGPAPCCCLIGRIGEKGAPFYVAESYYGTAPSGGRLYLGINDIDPADNTGEFCAEVATGEEAESAPRGGRNCVFRSDEIPGGEPIANAAVLLIYVDGLRYDVLREMAASGHLPVIKKYFIDGGTDFACAFTGFPSSTLASNATIYSGVFPDRSGIKGNNYFDRKKRSGGTWLEPFGPTAAADAQRPAGLHRLAVMLAGAASRPFPAARRRYLEKRETDVPLLEDYVRAAGMSYYSAIQPIQPESPPNRYELDACNIIPPFFYHHAKDYVDRINARYGLDMVLQPDAAVMNCWFPNLDIADHDSPRAQFGGGRRALYRLDRLLGAMIEELERKKLWRRTYAILFADHGTTGGKSAIVEKVDLGREFFHKPPADKDRDGAPDAGSGLGWNVRWYDDAYARKRPSKRSFVFLDHAEGAARVYLPFGGIDSGNWTDRNGLFQLTRYRVAEGAARVNLIERLLALDLGGENLYPGRVPERPVAFVLVKLDGERIAVFGQDSRSAIIEREKGRGERFRYIPARRIEASPQGEVTFDEAGDGDPLGYLSSSIPHAWLQSFHPAREWLEKTKFLPRPDAVPAIAHQMFWDGRMAAREKRFSPDLILCAADGWSFERPDEPAGAHGHLRYDTMHIPLFLRGPNVREGIVITDAVRNADIVPTVLSLLGVSFDGDRLDGAPLRGFLKRSPTEKLPAGAPLGAFMRRLPYEKERIERGDLLADYERRREVRKPQFLDPDTRYEGHDLERATDIHVIGTDLLSPFNWEAFNILDSAVDLAWPGRSMRPFDHAFDALVSAYDRLPDRYPKERIRELVFALQIREISAGEVPSIVFLSVGGLAGRGMALRASLLLRWMEHLFSDMDQALCYPLRRRKLRLVSNMNYLLGGLRLGLDKVSWGVAHYVGNALYDGIYHIEKGNEKIVRAVKRHGSGND